MIREIIIEDPITSEGQPDGGSVSIIDPYDGCFLRCPYCFQMNEPEWNKNIYVKINIADLLDKTFMNWPKFKTMYIGSKCDPYMKLEEKYQLTRKCLEKLDKWNIPTMIATKSGNDLIFRDIDLLKGFHADLTILIGMSNIKQIARGVDNRNIAIANELYKNGHCCPV